MGRIRSGVDERALAHIGRQVRIEVSRLHEDATLVGAACLIHYALFAGDIGLFKKVSSVCQSGSERRCSGLHMGSAGLAAMGSL